jgi:NADH:ubiquinone oxidoreductase subunit E
MKKIIVCIGRSCKNSFSDDVVKEVSKKLKCKINEYSEDGQFEFLSANCMNNCNHGPSVNFDGKLYSEMTPKEAKKLI